MSADGGAARILVVTAIREELAAFARKRLPPGVVAAATGDGPVRAARSVAALCAHYRPGLLIGAGVAGGLTPDLGAGDLVVGHRILDADGEAPPPLGGLVVAAAAKPGAQQGTLLTLDRPLVSPSEKEEWGARVGPPPATVDMESAAWARAAAGHGVPFLIVRIVSDTAEEELPGYLSRCMDSQGGIRRSAVALSALLHPRTIPRLRRMRTVVLDCADRLAEFVLHVAGEVVLPVIPRSEP
jgi:adenosylhomocysteine nucleosidase